MSDLTKQQAHRCAQLLTRPGWHGKYHTGHLRCVKALKRYEANERNGATTPGEGKQAGEAGVKDPLPALEVTG